MSLSTVSTSLVVDELAGVVAAKAAGALEDFVAAFAVAVAVEAALEVAVELVVADAADGVCVAVSADEAAVDALDVDDELELSLLPQAAAIIESEAIMSALRSFESRSHPRAVRV